ncbi:MAG: hypothetical protein [Caudoviricetes sp.]|nr:MAG: hypothetical protein [Caudoviricetes sp.]
MPQLTRVLNSNLDADANIRLVYESLTDMINDESLLTNRLTLTYKNQYGVISNARWKIKDSSDINSFTVTLANGKFAILQPRSMEEYASFGFGKVGDIASNLAATTEAHRVANLQPHMRGLEFPSGIHDIDTTNLDVARRGFHFKGKGFDITWLRYRGAALQDSLCLVLDDVNPLKTREHFYQKLTDLTVDGGMENDFYASSVAINGHYPYVNIKTVGHFYANTDLNGLSGTAFIHSQGRQSPTNPAFATRVGVKVNYNAWDIKGYLGSGIANRATVEIDGGETTLTVSATAGTNTLTVADASKFRRHFQLEIEPEGGAGVTEAISIQSVSGNVITLKQNLVRNHAAGKIIKNPVFGVNIQGAVIEVGEFRVGNSDNVNVEGCYFEGALPTYTNFPRYVHFHHNIVLETFGGFANNVNRSARFNVHDNEMIFPFLVNSTDRSGGTSSILDIYNMPYIDFDGTTRGQNSILVNSASGVGGVAFRSLKITDTYSNSLSDNWGRSMEFTGLSVDAAALSSTTAIEFYQILGAAAYSGYSYDLSVTMRRGTSVVPGFAKIAGITGNSGGTPVQTTSPYGVAYQYWDNTNGVNVTLGSTVSKGSIVCKGEPSGSQVTKFNISGKVTSIQ